MIIGNNMPTKAQDRYVLVYTLVSLMFIPWSFFWNLMDEILNLYIFLILILILSLLILISYLFIELIRNAVGRRWRRVVSVVAAPIALYYAFTSLGSMTVQTYWVRLELYMFEYSREIAALPHNKDSIGLLAWDWGATGGVPSGECFKTLLYDNSDQIGLPPNKRSAAWKSAVMGLKGGNMVTAHPLFMG